ncbi:L,D-transpeptidase [Microbacterium sp. VKM Ac-2870]|uniref:L,D-transpeptidase n=1 Tax=Microbacterium sp. VKM Ac-2870 TaxID=2783825 RepID=UPI001E371DCD|nr:L,D-transpeptidase [Microbacterium sp. VKM Ac-2870]
MLDPRRRPRLFAAVTVLAAAGILCLAGCGTPAASAPPAFSPQAEATATATPSPTPTPTPTPTPAPAIWTVHANPAPDPNCTGPGREAAQDGVLHVYVSITAQHLWECSGENLLMDSAVTTGASGFDPDYATPTGTFAITRMTRDTELVGHDSHGSWDDKVAYWMPFQGGDVGFHDASWQTVPFGGDGYLQNGSHGCVHMPTDAIAHLYADVSVGTRVTVR